MPVAPAAPPYTVYISVASFLIALLALIRGYLTDRRSRRLERDSRFESAYGSHLRDELRSFEKRVSEFRTYTFPSGKTVGELKSEIEDFRVKLEEEAFVLQGLLREIDRASTVQQTGWETAFSEQTERAELGLQSISHAAVVTTVDFRAKAEGARDAYQRAIDSVRDMIVSELSRP